MVASRDRGSSTVSLFRRRPGRESRELEDAGKVTFEELFFDLVFVFSVVQLSHTMAADYSVLGVTRVVVMILAVWWEWIFTTWAVNWVHPESWLGRLLLFALMLLALLGSTSIPFAFGRRAWVFAAAHTTAQVGRSAVLAVLMMPWDRAHANNFWRITIWLAAATPLWFLGAAERTVRLPIWMCALGVEYVGPALAFCLPWLGKSTTTEWDVIGTHVAERCALFVIICLGETILVIGTIYSAADVETSSIDAAFTVAFGTSLSLWWTYFRFAHKQAATHIELAEDPGAVARLVFTYVHAPIVAGIIFSAVGMRFLLDYPQGLCSPKTASALTGGPALYLCGVLQSKSIIAGKFMHCHSLGVFALCVIFAVVAVFHPHVTLLQLSLLVLLVLIAVATAEHQFEHRKPDFMSLLTGCCNDQNDTEADGSPACPISEN